MTAAAVRRTWPLWVKVLLALGAASIAVLSGLIWYGTTDSFQAMVRRRLVAELERITGAQVELGSVHAIPFRFHIEVRDLTLHGKEPPGSVPYAHVDSLVAQIKVISALGAEFGFHSIVLVHPVIHIIVNPDGTTNQPVPEVPRASESTPVEQLFALSISQLEVRHGEVLWNDAVIPMDFSATDIQASMTYSILRDRYDCELLLGRVDTKLKELRPFAWTVETHFALEKNLATIRSLKATSGRTHLDARGQIVDFRHPKFEGNYDVTVDLAEVSGIARQNQIRGGVLQANGSGSWSGQEFASAGNILLKDFDWNEPSLSLRGVGGSSDFSLDQKHLKLTQLQTRLFSGSVSGSLEVLNWLTSSAPVKANKRESSDQQEGTLRLQFKAVSVNEAAIALSTRAMPLRRMNAVGSGNGTVQARWKGTLDRIELESAFDILPPVRAALDQIPITATGRVAYRALPGELQVDEFTLGSRSSQVHASGTLSKAAALRFSVNTTDLSEWELLISMLHGPNSLPVTLGGRAVLIATASGQTSDPVVNGTLESTDFDLRVPAPGQNSTQDIHWDSLSSDLQISQHALSLRHTHLVHDQTDVRVDLSAQLHQGEFAENSPFTAHLNIQQMDAGEVLALTGQRYPVAGVIRMVAQASGTRANPRADGQMQLSEGEVYGQSVGQISSAFIIDREHFELTDFRSSHGKAEIAGKGSYDWNTQGFAVMVKGSNFNLASFPELQRTRIPVEGRLDFTAQGSGTVSEPSVNATVRLSDLAFDHERAGNFTLQASTKGADLALSGRSEFEHATLAIDGSIRTRDDWPADIRFSLDHFDVDSLLMTYLRERATGHSAVAGDVRVRGPLRNIRQVSVEANLTSLFAEVNHIQVRNDGPLELTLANQELKVRQFRLAGEGTDLSVTGQVELAGNQALNFHSQGHLNLQLIQTLDSDFTSAGNVLVDAAVDGTVANPALHGKLQISKASIAYIDLPSALSDINGTVAFTQNRAEIVDLSARVGGGLINLTGYANSYQGKLSFDLGAQAHEVRLRYPPGVSSTADLNLHFQGNAASSTLSGDITVTKLALTPGFDFGSYFESTQQGASLPQTDPLLNRIHLDVHVATLPELQMQTAVIRLSGDADLHLRGTAAKPVLLGRADVIEGEVNFNGTKYRLERGDILFTNPVSTTPVLDLQASTRVRDYDITLNVNGEVEKPNITYRSEPPLATADIIGLLAFGQTEDQAAQLQGTGGQSALAQEASGAILTEALNAAVGNRVQKLFGVSRIKIDPQGLVTSTSPTQTGPAVTIEQQVKDNLTMTYSTSISQASQQIIQVEYNLTRNISLVGIRDQNGVVSFVMKFRQRKN